MKMYTIKQFVNYRRSLDDLRNQLKITMFSKTMTFRFAQAAQSFLDIIEMEHEACNKKIGELTK